MKPNLKAIDRRIIEVMLRNEGPMTAAFIAKEISESIRYVCQRLGDGAMLAPMLQKANVVMRDSSDKIYIAHSYRLKYPVMVAQALFSSKTCPAQVSLRQVE